MRVAVASGKGGTGKTLVATNLAWVLAASGETVTYVDTDVEEPNGHLFLRPRLQEEIRFSVPLPVLRAGTCSACGACQVACAFRAITLTPDAERGGAVRIEPGLCHACGTCLLVCEEKALAELHREVGTLRRGICPDGLIFWSGELDVGEPRAAPLIRGLLAALQARQSEDGSLKILDAPPGTSCSVMAATRHADLVLLVTEPTPFGLHDLDLAVQMCQALGRPMAVVLNRADLGRSQEISALLQRREIPLLARIPFSPALELARHLGVQAAVVINKADQEGQACARVEQAVERARVPLLGRLPFDVEVPRALARGDLPLALPRLALALGRIWQGVLDLMRTG